MGKNADCLDWSSMHPRHTDAVRKLLLRQAVGFLCFDRVCQALVHPQSKCHVGANLSCSWPKITKKALSWKATEWKRCYGAAGKRLPQRNDFSWTALIAGYTNSGRHAEALGIYEEMQEEGVKPSTYTFVHALKACSGLGDLETGKKIHAQVIESGNESQMFVGTMLVDMYAKCGSMEDAHQVFHKLMHRDVVSWNAMILGCAKQQEGELALQLYAWMQQEGVAPNDRTFVGVLKACSSLATQEEETEVSGKCVKIQSLEKGRSIHFQAVKQGFGSNAFVVNALMDMYTKCGSMVDARHVFDGVPHSDSVSWNVMIQGYSEQGESEEAFRLYAQLRQKGLLPDHWTFASILKACGNTAALEIGKIIHSQIREAGLEGTDMILATALIDMYCKCGSMVDAQQVFDALPERNLVTWSALIAGYARLGESELVFRLFERMRQESIQPNRVTFLSVLTACSHAGLLDNGQEYFNAMSSRYGLVPTLEHYNSMVDLLGRAGQMEEMVALVEHMPFQPNLVTWTTVLGACQKWTSVELARYAFEHAMRLDKYNAASYVLMSNIYADAHMWEERDKVQAARGNARIRKKPGQSWWTDISGMVHTFVVGDTKHPQSGEIYEKMKALYARMEEEGYKPDLDSVLYDICDDEKEDTLCGHSEKLAIACALINTPPGTPLRVVKNLRVCVDCHNSIALISKMEGREITCRDASRFHVYKDGKCNCGDYW